ncbi:MAG: hypothetical protein HYY92_02405 [Parcubacteria group bacterium]|nr:hypothetical protein [Parcubacteria group bacterium]
MKNKKISALLSLLFPGLGHLYIGKYADGAVFFVAAAFLWYVMLFPQNSQALNFNSPRADIFWLGFTLVYFYAIADAYRKAGGEANIPKKTFSAPLFVTGGIALLFVMGGLLVFKGLWRPFSYSFDWKYEGIVITSENCNMMANPEIVQLSDGSWMMYTHGWPRKNDSRNDVYGYSSRDGLRWKAEGMLIEKASMPAAVQLSDGRIRLYFVRNTEEASGMMSALSSADGLHFSIEDGYRFLIGGGAPKDVSGFKQFYAVTGQGDPKDITTMAHLNIIKLEQGGYRIFFDEGGMRADVRKYGEKAWPISRVRSITSQDGLRWTLDSGVRIEVERQPLVPMQRAASSAVVKIGDEYHMYFSAGFSPWEDLEPWKRWAWSGIYEAVSKDGLNFSIIDKRLLSGGDAAIIKTDDWFRMYLSRSESGPDNCINIESWIKK